MARKHPARLLFFSSSEIYGNPDAAHVPTQESYHGNVSCLGARACYDESKRLGETLVRIYAEKFGVRGCIVRPFNVYGPGMQNLDYRVLPNFAAKILAGDPVNIYGTGNQTRTFCYVSDAIRGFLQVLLRGEPGEPYNIGNPEPEISMLELVETIKQALPERKVEYHIIEHPDTYPADEPQRRCPDITKARLQVGYAPRIELEEGLRRFFTWAEKTYRE
jgi:UDP-glucuronate decarboxylase